MIFTNVIQLWPIWKKLFRIMQISSAIFCGIPHFSNPAELISKIPAELPKPSICAELPITCQNFDGIRIYCKIAYKGTKIKITRWWECKHPILEYVPSIYRPVYRPSRSWSGDNRLIERSHSSPISCLKDIQW